MTGTEDRAGDRTGGRTEDRLVSAIQPLRHLAVAHAVYVLLDSGLAATLAEAPGTALDDLAERHAMAPDRLLGYLRYLGNEGYVEHDGGGWALTPLALEAVEFRPWYRMLVGGYAATFGAMGPTLKAGAPWADRNGTEVAAGSCGMSMFDTLPIAEELLDRAVGTARDRPATLVDLGCGDGTFLAELVGRRPGLRGVGLEPDPGAAALAARAVERADVAARVTVRQAGALEAPSAPLPDHGPVVHLAAFVLQELLEQDGRDAVVDLLRATTEGRPGAWWLVIEVDHLPEDPRLREGLGLAYYNPYYLLHAITEQRPVDAATWDELYAAAGLERVAVAGPDPDVDSTGLLSGTLLRRSPGRADPSA